MVGAPPQTSEIRRIGAAGAPRLPDVEESTDSGTSSAPPRRRPTIRDVARLVGVSESTVSHAFSGNRPVSPATLERVRAASAQLGYFPDPHARSMRTGRTGMIGLALRPPLAGDPALTDDETFNRLVGSAAIATLRRGIGLVHVPLNTADPTAGLPMDGCIVAHPRASDPLTALLERRGVPTVLIDDDPDRPSATPWTVRARYESGMGKVATLLARTGGAAPLLLITSEANAWSRAATSTFTASPGGAVLEIGPDTTRSEVAASLLRRLRAPGRPDSIVVAASDMVPLALRAVADAGLSVPEDVQIACLTDTSHSRELEVTGLDLRHEELAMRAVALLLSRIDGDDAPQAVEDVELHPTLRRSTR